MKVKSLLLLCLVLFSCAVLAQKREVGLGLGGFNYAGDLMRGYQITNVKPGILAFYKMNLDNIFSVRGSLTAGLISGSDQNPMDAFAANRDASFQSGIVEVAAMMEYNFLDYKADHVRFRWTPYFTAGISGFSFFGGEQELNGESKTQLAIPFGGGFKYMMNPKFTLNLEIGIRKLFFDRLDGYSDEDLGYKNYLYGNKFDNDWFNFIGISISYTFWDIPCPYDFY